jgi:hypothetical protein
MLLPPTSITAPQTGGRYELAGVEESPPSSDARRLFFPAFLFFIF